MSIMSWDRFVGQKQGDFQYTIDASELRLGDLVVGVENSAPELELPEQGLQIDSFERKQWLQQRCSRVVIDLDRSLHRQRPAESSGRILLEPVPAVPKDIEALCRRPLSARMLVDAWRVYREISQCAQAAVVAFSRHGELDIDSMQAAVANLADALDTQLPALIWLTRIKETPRYAFQHAINVAIISAGFAHAARWGRQRVEQAGMAGLLHDLGKTRLSLKVINKPGPLDDRELEHARSHARLGARMIASKHRLPTAVIDAVTHHHERPDGKGYPDGLALQRIPLLARLIGLVDAYDAMTSNRIHAAAISQRKAQGEIWEQRDRQFDPELAEAFNRFLGWVSPGTLLRLSNDDLAVVLNDGPGRGLNPRLCRLRPDGDGYRPGVELDLARERNRIDGETVRVMSLLPDGAEGVNMRDLTRRMPRALARSAPGSTGHNGARPSRGSSPRGLFGRGKPRERRRCPRVDAPRGLDILVVDDSQTVRRVLSGMLRQAGYEVETCERADAALARVRATPPDLLFLDIVLPDATGFSVLRELRAGSQTERLPVVMISGDSHATDEFFFKRVGADDFIPKPFGRREVFGSVERLIRGGLLPQRPVHQQTLAQPAPG